MREIELKFHFDQSMVAALWARVRSLELAKGPPRTRTLRSIYLDTSEHALKTAGISLRLRHDGRRWTQTVKTGRQMHRGLSQVDEVENAAPGGRVCLQAIPNDRVRDDVIRRVNGAVLQPVCETEFRRAAKELILENGTRAELAVDVGEIRARGGAAQICEIEIELRSGTAAGLYDIAKALMPAEGLQFCRLTKSARGYLLAQEGVWNRFFYPQCRGGTRTGCPNPP